MRLKAPSNSPPYVRVASVLYVQTNIPLRSPLGRSGNVSCPSSVDDIAGILPERTPLVARVGITINTRAVSEDRRAGVVCPYRIGDADGIL